MNCAVRNWRWFWRWWPQGSSSPSWCGEVTPSFPLNRRCWRAPPSGWCTLYAAPSSPSSPSCSVRLRYVVVYWNKRLRCRKERIKSGLSWPSCLCRRAGVGHRPVALRRPAAPLQGQSGEQRGGGALALHQRIAGSLPLLLPAARCHGNLYQPGPGEVGAAAHHHIRFRQVCFKPMEVEGKMILMCVGQSLSDVYEISEIQWKFCQEEKKNLAAHLISK